MLHTKLYRPTTKNNFVDRNELFRKLDKAKSRKLCLVSAPAGYGKTTMVSQWIEKNKLTYSWYSLDTTDNEPTEFLRYLIAGIQGVKNNFGSHSLKLLNSPNRASIESVVALLINNMLEIEEDLFVVLDDFHLISQKKVFDAVKYMLDHIPENIHLIILTRSDPPISISRLRSQNQLLEIRMADLGFTVNEIDILFNKKLKLGLRQSDIYSLEKKTEGWIAGLQLAALSLQGGADTSAFVKAFAGSNRYIMDYLIEEVLRNQADSFQDFLLKTSILKHLSAPLCDAVLDRKDSQSRLEQLERNNMFLLPLDNERKWYRYHHLFADLLKQRLSLKDQSIIKSLHSKASKWLEDHEMFDVAIEHSLINKDYERSFYILGKIVANLWEQGKHAAILEYGNSLPEALIKKNPEFCLYYSWIIIETGEVKKAHSLLLSAEKTIIQDKYSSNQAPDYHKRLLGKIYVAFAYLNAHEEGSDKAADYCQSAIEKLSAEDRLWLGWAWYIIGNEEMAKGNLTQGNTALRTALDYSKKTANLYLMSNITATLAGHKMGMGQYKLAFKQCADLLAFIKDSGYSEISKAEWTFAELYTIMSVMQCIWADFDEALENVKIAYHLCKNEKNIFPRINALLAYTYILYALEDRTGSFEKLQEFEAVMKQNQLSPFVINNYVGWKIFLLSELDQFDMATQFAEENGVGLNNKISYDNDFSHLQYARLLILQHQFDDAESLISKIHAHASSIKSIEMLVQVNIIYALLYKKMGQHEAAFANMLEAMELASEENLMNYFLFDLNVTKELIEEVVKIGATRQTKISKAFVKKLESAIITKGNRRKKKAEAYLNARELETLALLAEDLSNQEIANQLFISVNTVKTRLKNIFLKLNVDNRRGAYKKAKDQGYL